MVNPCKNVAMGCQAFAHLLCKVILQASLVKIKGGPLNHVLKLQRKILDGYGSRGHICEQLLLGCKLG